ncbi:hypothetical protein [Peribacillus simplex]|uniref:hypothetical protein n=1 Tax=Peribacillus simplex TaxID=1478 RepID=UPI003D2BBC93
MFNLKSKSFWKYALIILLFPVVVNFLLFQYKLPWVFGTSDNWLSFWGNYTGGLISAFVAYVIANSQIQKQLKLDLAKERYHKTINQLPALVRLKLELEKFIRELTRVKLEREKYIETNGGIRKKLEEYEEIEDFFEDSTGIEESKVIKKHYNIELANPEVFKYLEQVENVDLHVDLITSFNFYKEFSNALLYNAQLALDKENKLFERKIVSKADLPDKVKFNQLHDEMADAFTKKKNGWKTFYEENTLETFNSILSRLNSEIQTVKNLKESGDLTLNGNK